MAECDAPPKKEYIKADKTITVRQHQEKLEAWFEERDSRDIWQLLAACRSAVNIFSLRNSPTHPITFSCGHAHTLQRCREGSCLQILQIRNCSLSIRLTTSRWLPVLHLNPMSWPSMLITWRSLLFCTQMVRLCNLSSKLPSKLVIWKVLCIDIKMGDMLVTLFLQISSSTLLQTNMSP